jgi:hypothetical protein
VWIWVALAGIETSVGAAPLGSLFWHLHASTWGTAVTVRKLAFSLSGIFAGESSGSAQFVSVKTI